MDLKEKVVFISGSSRGIGKAIACAFAQAGCHVILNARKAVDPEVVEQIEAYGGKVAVVLGDVSQAQDVQRMVKEALAAFGKVDILVNNAGITNDKLAIGMKPDDFTKVIDVNLTGTFMLSQAFLKKMYKQKAGVIINMASVIGLHGNVGQANYAASKAGVIGLTKSIAKEGALRNIRVNAIAPGMIASDMTAVLSDKVKANIMQEIPLHRFGNAQEIAKTALFLAANDYITGQVITVDGGMTI